MIPIRVSVLESATQKIKHLAINKMKEDNTFPHIYIKRIYCKALANLIEKEKNYLMNPYKTIEDGVTKSMILEIPDEMYDDFKKLIPKYGNEKTVIRVACKIFSEQEMAKEAQQQ